MKTLPLLHALVVTGLIAGFGVVTFRAVGCPEVPVCVEFVGGAR